MTATRPWSQINSIDIIVRRLHNFSFAASMKNCKDCRDSCFGERKKCEYEFILVKKNNSQCSLSAATSLTGHTRFVYVSGSEKAKEAEWLSSCVLQGSEISAPLESNSQKVSDLNLLNYLVFSQALKGRESRMFAGDRL